MFTFCSSPDASVPREKGEGPRRWVYTDLLTLVGSVCGDQLVTLGYLICTVLKVGFRAVPSVSQAVLVVVGALSAGPTFIFYYPVYEVGLHLRLSLGWMVRFE